MQIHLVDVVAPVVVTTLFIAATSVFKEPQRRHFNAIMLAGAGAPGGGRECVAGESPRLIVTRCTLLLPVGPLPPLLSF